MAYSKEFLEHMAQTQDTFIWEMPSSEEVERGPRWFLYMSLVALALAAYAVYTANYLFAFIVLLTAIILIFAGNEKPRKVLVQIGHNGIVVEGRLYRFDQLSNFAIIYHPPQTKVLYLEPNGVLQARLRVDLVDEDPVAIRNHLKQYLQEDLDLQEEHFSDIIGRLLKL